MNPFVSLLAGVAGAAVYDHLKGKGSMAKKLPAHTDETDQAIRLMLKEAKKFDQMGLLLNVENDEVPESGFEYGETVYSLISLYSSAFNVEEKALVEALVNAYPDHFPSNFQV